MSQIALFMALLLLPLHACNARNTFAFVSYTKDGEKVTLHETNHVKVFPVLDTEELLGRKTRSVMDNMDKNQRAMGMKDMMENARTLVESAAHETKEATYANEDESMGDVVVTDYVRPRRKSPIHNRH